MLIVPLMCSLKEVKINEVLNAPCLVELMWPTK